MSAEIVQRENYFARESDTELERDFQHDLEAFFWVLVYLCLSRGAPGLRRPELLIANINKTVGASQRLQMQVRTLFESDEITMGGKKYEVMKYGVLEPVLECFSDWCRPLVPLVKAFHKALVDAYSNRKTADLYDTVISAFDEALEVDALKDDSEHSKKYLVNLQEEMERRMKNSPGDWDNVNSPLAKTTKDGLKLGSTAQFLPQAPPSLSPGPRAKRVRLGQQ